MYINKKKKYIKYKIMFMLFFIGVTTITTFIYIDREIMPTVKVIGELKAQDLITRAVSIGVSAILENKVDYQDLVSIKEDSEGNITLMQANTMYMNKIASDVALSVQEELSQTKTTSERIPLGNAFGSQLLAQYGPKVKLTVTPLGAVDVNFGTEFEQSGINQTRHRIFLIVTTNVSVIVPFNSTPKEVITYVPLAETIIVGRVPHTLFQVPNDKFLNISPLYGE